MAEAFRNEWTPRETEYKARTFQLYCRCIEHNATQRRAFHQRGPPTIFMCLALYATCACHLVIFSKKSLFVDAINYRPADKYRPDSSISLEYYLIL